MILQTNQILYPEGDHREIEHRLRVNQMVDLNGNPVSLPLRTPRTIVYRVFKITTRTLTGEVITNYHLERVGRLELEEHVGR